MPRLACRAACEYWDVIETCAEPYPGARELMAGLEERGWEVLIVTGSDFRLSVDASETKAQLWYNPELSGKLKARRVYSSPLFRQRELEGLTLGDSLAKPDFRFWSGVLGRLNIKEEDPRVMIGNVWETDACGLNEAFGFKTILVDRNGRYRDASLDDVSAVVSNLPEAWAWLEANVLKDY